MLTGSLAATVRAKIFLIRADPHFSGLDAEARALLAQHGRYRRFEAGERIYRAGQEVSEVHTLYAGEAEIRRPDRAPHVVRAPGGMGWPSWLCGAPAFETVAQGEVRTLAFDVEVVSDLFELNFSLVRNGLQIVSRVLLDKRAQLPAPPGRDQLGPLGDCPREPATLVERMLDLRRLDIFRQTNFEAVSELARTDREVRFEDGAALWRAGQPALWGLRLRWGRVRCETAEGQAVIVSAPQVLGLAEGLAGRPHGYNATAEGRVVAYESRLDHFFAILEDHFDLSMRTMALMSRPAFLE